MAIIPIKMRRFFVNKSEMFISKMKQSTFPGFDEIPVYDVMAFFFAEIKRDKIIMRAAAISFNFLLAIFPSIIFLFTLVAYIPVDSLNTQLMSVFADILPTSGYAFLAETIDDIISIKRGGLLSFGFVLAFYFSTNGMLGLMRAFNKEHHIYRKRNFWKTRLAAFRLTLYLFVLFIISITLIVAGDDIVYAIKDFFDWQSSTYYFMLTVFKWLIIVLLFFISISIIYYYGPATKHRWRFITPGASFATILSIVTSLAFGFFVNTFARYNEVYGSIGTLIVLMIWINLNAQVLLVGFEINNSIDVNRVLRKKIV